MVIAPLPAAQPATGYSRALIVGLTLVPVVLVTLASVPALIVMPFIPQGRMSVDAHIAKLAAWTTAILIGAAGLTGRGSCASMKAASNITDHLRAEPITILHG